MSHDGQDFDARPLSAGMSGPSQAPVPTNAVKIEFANYAQAEVQKKGSKGGRRYEFEHWGTTYQWRRVIRKNDLGQEVSFHLFRANGGQALAHIVPESLTPMEQYDERSKGGWVPPCSMWISDENICRMQGDISE